jgi:hypothetical protein
MEKRVVELGAKARAMIGSFGAIPLTFLSQGAGGMISVGS